MAFDSRSSIDDRARGVGARSAPFEGGSLYWFGIPLVVMLVALGLVTVVMFSQVRPPTVDEIEDDMWTSRAKHFTDSEERTFADLLIENARERARQLLDSLGKSFEEHGDSAVVPTKVRYMALVGPEREPFVAWRGKELAGDWRWPEVATHTDADDWKVREIPLYDQRTDRIVGYFRVSYRFYDTGLQFLPRIGELPKQHRWVTWLVATLVAVVLLAVLANIGRLRERAERVRHQQMTLDLARQLCHELRNGLWAFSLEGNNLRQFLRVVEDYFRIEEGAFTDAADRMSWTPEQRDRWRRAVQRHLAAAGVDPKTDVLPAGVLARQAYRQIDGFARYINLTIEELDRHLLGGSATFEPKPTGLHSAWEEACELLALRLRTASIVIETQPVNGDDRITADRRDLVHVFVNLAKNALEAMRDFSGARILEFSAGRANGRVFCTVRNVGPPIPPADLAKLFDRGFTTKHGLGRGAGLKLVLESVDRMGGHIHVESSAQSGTCFRLDFPPVVTAANDVGH